MRVLSFCVYALCLAVIMGGCASQKQKQELAEKASRVKYIEFDNPKRCSIHKQCKYIRNLACWARPGDFESVCTARFKSVAAKFGGDTYLYLDIPKKERSNELLQVYGDIYRCSSQTLSLGDELKRSLENKPFFKVKTIRHVPLAYQNECNILDKCEPHLKVESCITDHENARKECYNRLRKKIQHYDISAYLIEHSGALRETTDKSVDDRSLKYEVSGTTYLCPDSIASILPKYNNKDADRTPDYIPDMHEITNDDHIPKFEGTGEISIINEQLSTESIRIYKWGPASFFVKLKDPSELFAKQLAVELGKRGFKVTKNAKRTIKVSITSMNIVYRGFAAHVKWMHKGGMVYVVKYGDNKKIVKQTYNSENVLFGGFGEIVNRVVAGATVEVLNNSEFRDYLK